MRKKTSEGQEPTTFRALKLIQARGYDIQEDAVKHYADGVTELVNIATRALYLTDPDIKAKAATKRKKAGKEAPAGVHGIHGAATHHH